MATHLNHRLFYNPDLALEKFVEIAEDYLKTDFATYLDPEQQQLIIDRVSFLKDFAKKACFDENLDQPKAKDAKRKKEAANNNLAVLYWFGQNFIYLTRDHTNNHVFDNYQNDASSSYWKERISIITRYPTCLRFTFFCGHRLDKLLDLKI